MRGLTSALLVAAAVLLWTAPSMAQSARDSAPVPGISVTWNSPPAQNPLPAAPGGPPSMPGHQHGGMAATGDVFQAGPLTYAPRFDRVRGHRNRLSYPFGHSPLVAGYGGYVGTTLPVERSGGLPDGWLLLTVLPRSARVFVDGFYVGTGDDWGAGGQGIAIEAGPHRIELRAEGYETDTFDIRVVPGESIRYRRELRSAQEAPRPPAQAAAASPKTFYVIAGCYAGDTRPRSERLPSGCRLDNLRTVPPVVSVVSPAADPAR